MNQETKDPKTASRKLRLFFTANAFSSVGMNIGIVGVAWFIIQATGQNRILGIYNAISLLSAFAALTVCGTLIDHKSKTAVMKYCCLAQGLLFILTALLCKSGFPTLWIIYLLAFFNMPGMVIFTTASRGAVPAVLPSERLAKGNSLIEVTLQLGAMAAALLTAFFYGQLGFPVLMWLGAAFTLAGGGLFAYAKNAFDCPAPPSAGWRRNLTDGLAYLWGNKQLFVYGMIVFLPTIIISVSNVIIPGYVQFTLQKGALVYGFSDMLFALGALAAGICAVRLKDSRENSVLQKILFILSIAGMVFFAVNTSLGGFFTGIFITGVAMAGLRVLLNTSFMYIISAEYLGRALAVLMALSVVLQALLSYLMGVLMDSFGISAGFICIAGLLLVGFMIWLFLSAEKFQLSNQ